MLVAFGAVIVAVTTGCAPTAPNTSATPSASPTASAASPTPSPTGLALVPDGDASDNLPLFTEVMDAVWDTDDRVKGRAYVDALVEAGFDKGDMEVTRDKTSVGLPSDSIQFSVRWDDECIVGQVGPSTKRPTAVVLPTLPTGACLVGETRPIDW